MTTTVEPAVCHNCNAPLYGRFCAACGQEDRPLDPGLGDVVSEVAREVSALDGRIVRSVRRLFLSPGFLTIEHFEGRRVAWVSPVRLYLVFSVAYFAVTSFSGVAPLDVNLRLTGDTPEATGQTLETMGFTSQDEMQQAVNRALAIWIPRAMFVLVPVFGWLVSRVRRGTARKYPHHLIFALHIFAALFGAQTLAVAAGYLAGHAAAASALGVASLVYAAIYLVLALRAVYGGTLLTAFTHAVVVLVLYWIATLAVVGAIIVPVLF